VKGVIEDIEQKQFLHHLNSMLRVVMYLPYLTKLIQAFNRVPVCCSCSLGAVPDNHEDDCSLRHAAHRSLLQPTSQPMAAPVSAEALPPATCRK
jgi:hypothetical protein